MGRGRRREKVSVKEKENSIYFRLPVPSRSRMIYAERVPRLHAAGEFSLSVLHPAVSPGWQSVALPSLSQSSQHRIAVSTTMHLSWMTCNYRPSFCSSLSLSLSRSICRSFSFSSFFYARAHTRGCLFRREANHRATTNILSYACSKWTVRTKAIR